MKSIIASLFAIYSVTSSNRLILQNAFPPFTPSLPVETAAVPAPPHNPNVVIGLPATTTTTTTSRPLVTFPPIFVPPVAAAALAFKTCDVACYGGECPGSCA
eukprot:354075_1